MQPPPELLYALAVNIDNLRPWEYDLIEADVYDEIRLCRETWARATRDHE